MSYLRIDPETFTQQSADGFAAAHHDLVRRVTGGVVRSTRTPEGQVAVVIGGGSGHYPAFAGLVGRGLAHGAAMGEVFASPSAHRVWSVAKTAASDAGVLLSYGNYAGDVLNFDQAQERLREEGIPCETVLVTDDVFSASVDELGKRRGIAGDLAVFRAAGWAAEQGLPLEGVAELARRANARTRTIGVAFSGCTLPGATEPLFTVPDGQMAVGMGIHGEPGIELQPVPTAADLARYVVDRLLQERPDGADGRVAVILNGLGSVKAEELYLLYGELLPLFERAGLELVDPEVGEFATSFEMAGLSLTLFWLDDELEEAWRSPAWTPAYRKGSVEPADGEERDEAVAEEEVEEAIPPASDPSRAAAGLAVRALAAVREAIDGSADELGRLDSIAGDGDHGIGMQRGSTAAADEARAVAGAGAGVGTTLRRAGDAWAESAGGTSGALWGAALVAAGGRLGDDDAVDAAAVADAVAAARDAIVGFGRAELGDKTMVDALVPFADTLRERVDAGEPLAHAWGAAVEAARTAAQATAQLTPRVGRARPHAEKSVGTPDPGAVSFSTAVGAAAAISTTGDTE